MFNNQVQRAALRGTLVLVSVAALAGCGDSLSTPESRTAAPPRPASATAAVSCPTGFTYVGRWQNVDWCAYNGVSNPQNNAFLRQNVQWTSSGLTLSAPKVAGKWTGAWVCTAGKYAGGSFQFGVSGRLDQLDPNVVFGMYLDDLGDSPSWHELDIEFALWGAPWGKRLQYVVWGNAPMSPVKEVREYDWGFTANDTRHVIVWRPSASAEFQSYTQLMGRSMARTWTAKQRIPARAMHACVILWYSTPGFKDGMTPVGPVSGRAPSPIRVTQFTRDVVR